MTDSQPQDLSILDATIPANPPQETVSPASAAIFETLIESPTFPTLITSSVNLDQSGIRAIDLNAERDLLSTVCTSPPYFSLGNVSILSPKTVQATITPECLHPQELSAFSASEAGRHLAILGSCAVSLARKNKRKEYFLASSAEYNWVAEAPRKSQFYGIATAFPKGARSAIAKTNLFDSPSQTRIATLTVEYQILSPKIFEKIFKAHYSAHIPSIDQNPYTSRYKIEKMDILEDGAKATFSPVLPENCAGHFTHYYAMPVAVLMGVLMDCAGAWLRKTMVKDRYRVEYANIQAHQLLFAGSGFSANIKRVDIFNNSIFFMCKGENDQNETIGSMDLQFILQ